jgi:hypothetical protein
MQPHGASAEVPARPCVFAFPRRADADGGLMPEHVGGVREHFRAVRCSGTRRSSVRRVRDSFSEKECCPADLLVRRVRNRYAAPVTIGTPGEAMGPSDPSTLVWACKRRAAKRVRLHCPAAAVLDLVRG